MNIKTFSPSHVFIFCTWFKRSNESLFNTNIFNNSFLAFIIEENYKIFKPRHIQNFCYFLSDSKQILESICISNYANCGKRTGSMYLNEPPYSAHN
jgi:hypothetical protein